LLRELENNEIKLIIIIFRYIKKKEVTENVENFKVLCMGDCVYPDFMPLSFHSRIRHSKCRRDLEGTSNWNGVCLGSWWML
jgi:hypothetical protein